MSDVRDMVVILTIFLCFLSYSSCKLVRTTNEYMQLKVQQEQSKTYQTVPQQEQTNNTPPK